MLKLFLPLFYVKKEIILMYNENTVPPLPVKCSILYNGVLVKITGCHVNQNQQRQFFFFSFFVEVFSNDCSHIKYCILIRSSIWQQTLRVHACQSFSDSLTLFFPNVIPKSYSQLTFQLLTVPMQGWTSVSYSIMCHVGFQTTASFILSACSWRVYKRESERSTDGLYNLPHLFWKSTFATNSFSKTLQT